jgi:hypothetical protein
MEKENNNVYTGTLKLFKVFLRISVGSVQDRRVNYEPWAILSSP